MQVIVVTDSLETKQKMRRILRALGTTFSVVWSPQEAEVAMALETPAAIVIDMQWPRRNGWVLGKWITSRVPDGVRVILSEDTPLVRGIHVWQTFRRATFLPNEWEVEEIVEATEWRERQAVA